MNQLSNIMYNKKLKDQHLMQNTFQKGYYPLVLNEVLFDNEWVVNTNEKLGKKHTILNEEDFKC